MRTGLRWGGKEPILFPPLAMEVSVWYEGQFRTGAGNYGFGDFTVEPHSHLFWGEALLSYTFPKSKQNLYLSLTAGTSIDADRFSAYRLGALLPLVSEFPLSLPGYYYQEISAKAIRAGGRKLHPPARSSATLEPRLQRRDRLGGLPPGICSSPAIGIRALASASSTNPHPGSS